MGGSKITLALAPGAYDYEGAYYDITTEVGECSDNSDARMMFAKIE